VVEVRGHSFILDCGLEASLCAFLRQRLRDQYEEVESFWMVLGGVEVNSGCIDTQNGFVDAGQAVLVFSWFGAQWTKN
jgi:hypothetical protein